MPTITHEEVEDERASTMDDGAGTRLEETASQQQVIYAEIQLGASDTCAGGGEGDIIGGGREDEVVYAQIQPSPTQLAQSLSPAHPRTPPPVPPRPRHL
jgi:hypothetical protein